jgi:hypothetical protein
MAGTAAAQFNITGTVTGPSSAPVPLVELRLYTGTGIAIGIPVTVTSASGTYAINGLPSGSYLVEFRPPAVTRLLAAQLPVTVSGAHATRNAPLEAGVLLSGYVRDTAGVGIPAIDLQVRDRRTRELILTPGDDTDAVGFYDVVVPPSEYDLEWRAIAAGSLPWIPVVMREVVETDTVIDVTMVVGMFVSGRITDILGVPLAGANLDFIDQATGIKALTPGDNTLADGTFTAQVPVGVYTVVVKPLPGTHLLAGLLVNVNVATNMTGLNASLQPGVLVSGVVTGPGGQPVEGVDIDVNHAASGVPLTLAYDVTDIAGAYQIVVPQGAFDVVFSPPVATVLPCLTAAARTIVFDTVLNAALPAGALLTGSVTSGGVPVPGTDIDVINPLTGASQPLVDDGVGAAGTFATVVPLGTWHVEIEPPLATGLVAQRLLNRPVNGTVNLPVALVAGLRLTGTLTSAQGAPVPGANVDARRMSDLVEVFTPADHTNALGVYVMIVPAGNYRLVFKPGAPYTPADSLSLDNQLVLVDSVVNASMPGASAVDPTVLPGARVSGVRASPNPFNPLTRIRFTLGQAGPTRLAVHGLDGRLVRLLADGVLAAGDHEWTWDGRDDRGRPMSSGLYLAIVTSGGSSQSTKLALVK